jgi:diguanylate cyclase (GGDEF)-like protein
VPPDSRRLESSHAPSRVDAWLFAGSVLTVVLVLAVVGLGLWQQRLDAWRAAVRSAENLRGVLALEIANRLRFVEIALDEVVQSYSESDIPPAAKSRILARAASPERFIGTFVIVDPAGDIALDTVIPPRVTNVADRDYFRIHVDEPQHGLFISRPFRSRLRGGDPTIAFSRRLVTASGEFEGVAVAAFRLAYFRALFSSIDVGEDGIIAVNRSDGILIARFPPLPEDEDMGMDVSGSANFQRIIREGTGTFTARAAIDGVDRLYSFSPIAGTNLLLTVGTSVDAIYAEWNRRALVIGGATLFICTLLVVQALTLRRELRRRTAAEARLATLSMTDALTGLPNRRQFDDFLDREWRRAGRTGATLSLLLVDADRFKEFNDRHGHVHGDGVLRTLAATIAGSIRRPGDLAARYGGEEFAVVMPDTDGAGARRVAETIRARVSAEIASDSDLPLTVSIGVATARPQAGEPIAALISAADEALYAAKRGGRDQIREAHPVDRPLEPAAGSA